MKRLFLWISLMHVLGQIACAADPAKDRWDAANTGNPILPGYYADPAHVEYQGKHYIYATLDPWGGDTLGCWESADFKTWAYKVLNWPTKKACTSPTSGGARVWAPSVVRARDGKFYMYISVGNEIWAGTADTPLGPWRDLLGGGKPLVGKEYRPGFHMIDAEAFIDDDGSAYLYWGSGWGYKNGKCWVVKLMPDMVTFDGEVRDVTPANYFEAPFMLKHGGKYYLSYSQGNTTVATYRVHYAIGDTPFGPFKEAANSPILVTDKDRDVISPGHHAVVSKDGKPYILYHRHSIPFPNATLRQLCLDPLVFTPDGLIEKVVPTHRGLPGTAERAHGRRNLAAAEAGATATSANSLAAVYGPERVLDNNYATRWMAEREAVGNWLRIDLGAVKKVSEQELRMEFAWNDYKFVLEASRDGQTWTRVADHGTHAVSGSPIIIKHAAPVQARYLRIVFPENQKGVDLGMWEWAVY